MTTKNTLRIVPILYTHNKTIIFTKKNKAYLIESVAINLKFGAKNFFWCHYLLGFGNWRVGKGEKGVRISK